MTLCLYKNYTLKMNSLSCVLLALQVMSEPPYKPNINMHCKETLTLVLDINAMLQWLFHLCSSTQKHLETHQYNYILASIFNIQKVRLFYPAWTLFSVTSKPALPILVSFILHHEGKRILRLYHNAATKPKEMQLMTHETLAVCSARRWRSWYLIFVDPCIIIQLIKQPTWCSLYPLSLLFLGKHSTCFGCSLHPSSGVS
jgi:hypothetical protein